MDQTESIAGRLLLTIMASANSAGAANTELCHLPVLKPAVPLSRSFRHPGPHNRIESAFSRKMEDSKLVQLQVRVTTELRNRAKAAAALKGMSLQDWVTQVLRTELEREGERPGRKTRDKKL
jgi:HicB family